MMVAEAWRKLPPSSKLQLERHSLLRGLMESGGDASYEALYTTEAGVRSIFERLGEAERKAITAVVRCFANTPFDEAALVKQAGDGVPGAELRVGLAGLCSAGIVVTVRKAWGERLHTLPCDALGAWQHALFGKPDAEVPEAQVELTESSLGRLDDDLFALLAYAAKQELVVTQKGALHKRQLLTLKQTLQLADSKPLQRMGMSYGYADVYDAGTAVVLDAALRLELLALQSGALRVVPARLAPWLRLPRERRSAALRAAWLARLWPSEPLGQHAAAAALAAPRGVWLALPRLAGWLARSVGAAAEPLAQLAAAQWLEPLAALGWLELGRHAPSGRLALRIPASSGDAGQQPGRFYVQPDFEIVVPPDVPAAVRWELERYAERTGTDQVHLYRLTRDSVQFGCEQGATAGEIETFLEAHGRYELPDNVRQGIRQWAAAYGRASFARALLLRCDSRELADQLAAHPKLAELLLERLGDTDFIVPAGNIAELQDVLGKAGYAPRKAIGALGEADIPGRPAFPLALGINSPDGSDGAGTFIAAEDEEDDIFRADTAAKGLLHATDPLLFCELEPELPERRAAAALPDLRNIPAAWWKDYRAYHASTRKELIRKAIEWQSLLKLRKDGRDRIVAPQRLLEERDGWSLVGTEQGSEILVRSDAWDEMKLVVPGLNDR